MNPNPEQKRSRSQIVALSVVGAGVAAALITAAFAAPGLRSGAAAGGAAAPAPSASSAAASAAATPQPTATVGIDDSKLVKHDFSVEVVKTEAVKGVAEDPGEIAGPAVRFTIALHNDAASTIDLTSTVVNAYYGSAQTPALPLLRPGGRNLPASLAAGGTATGVYVFVVPRSQRALVKLTVDTAVKNPVIAFTGAVPR